MAFFKKLTIVNKGLRYKLMVAFSLMSIIPLLACTYLISCFIFPQLDTLAAVSAVVVISLAIAILGLILAKSLVDPVIEMAVEAKIIASGEFDRKISTPAEDEIGNLADSINFMTQKIRSNMDELKGYGQRMGEVNAEIHKKVLALANLLQIGDIISGGSSQLDPLLELALEKATTVFDGGYGILYMPKEEGGDFIQKTSYNVTEELLSDIVIKVNGHGLLEDAIATRSTIVLDKATKITKELATFKIAANISNCVIIPLYSAKRNLGLLLIGTRQDDFKYKIDDTELVKVFAKQMAIAVESDCLARKTNELSITDDLTNLYNKRFLMTRLEEEIKRAIFYQRPCSLVVFGIDNFEKFRNAYGELVAEEALKRLARLIKDNLIPVGKAARVSGDEFAILLPEKNKKEAYHIAEEMKKKLDSANLLRNGNATVMISAGVSENPIDGATGEELFKKASDSLKSARASGKSAIVA